METAWWPPKCIFSFETEVKTCHGYECTVFLDQQCLFFHSRGIPLLIYARAHARSRLNPRSTRWNIDQKLSATSCQESAAPVGYSGHFLIALMSQTEMKSPTVKKKNRKEDLPGNLEAATLPKEQGSLPHDAFVFPKIHIFFWIHGCWANR